MPQATMTTPALIDTIATHAGVSKETAKTTWRAILDRIAGNLITGAAVRLDGVGILSLSHVEEGIGRNPKTGQEVVVDAYNRGSFKVAKGLKRPGRPAKAA